MRANFWRMSRQMFAILSLSSWSERITSKLLSAIWNNAGSESKVYSLAVGLHPAGILVAHDIESWIDRDRRGRRSSSLKTGRIAFWPASSDPALRGGWLVRSLAGFQFCPRYLAAGWCYTWAQWGKGCRRPISGRLRFRRGRPCLRVHSYRDIGLWCPVKTWQHSFLKHYERKPSRLSLRLSRN